MLGVIESLHGLGIISAIVMLLMTSACLFRMIFKGEWFLAVITIISNIIICIFIFNLSGNINLSFFPVDTFLHFSYIIFTGIYALFIGFYIYFSVFGFEGDECDFIDLIPVVIQCVVCSIIPYQAHFSAWARHMDARYVAMEKGEVKYEIMKDITEINDAPNGIALIDSHNPKNIIAFAKIKMIQPYKVLNKQYTINSYKDTEPKSEQTLILCHVTGKIMNGNVVSDDYIATIHSLSDAILYIKNVNQEVMRLRGESEQSQDEAQKIQKIITSDNKK